MAICGQEWPVSSNAMVLPRGAKRMEKARTDHPAPTDMANPHCRSPSGRTSRYTHQKGVLIWSCSRKTTHILQMIRQVFDIATNPEGPAGSGGEGTLGEAESFSTSGLAAAAADSVHQALRVCGVTALSARKVFIEVEGIDNLEALGTLNGDTDVTEMAKRMASRPANAGKVILGTMQIKRLQALVYWVKDHEKRQITLDADLWTPEELKATIARKEAEHNFEKVDVTIVDPGKCRTDVGWDSWQIGFMNKLSSTLGTAKVPLASIVREDKKNMKSPFPLNAT